MRPEPRDLDQLRMMTKVAHLYHNRKMGQSEIARTMGLSQARVSRLLSAAEAAAIVRTIVVPPEGLNTVLEESLERRFGLREVHVVDAAGETDAQRTETLGRALANVFEILPIEDKTIGFTSWSRSMRHFVSALGRLPHTKANKVVEMLGGVGQPAVQHEATTATERLSTMTGAKALFLRVPGVVPSVTVKNAILETDPYARQALDALENLDIALIGVGGGHVVPPLIAGDNFFTEEQLDLARSLGAVGEINLRFMDKNGAPIESELNDLVIGVTLEQLKRAERCIAVSGGANKHRALLAAVRGGWIDVLVTDEESANYLIKHGPAN